MIVVQVHLIVQEETTMDAKSYSAVRKDLAKIMEKVCDDHSPIIITRKNARAVVMMSLEDFNAIEETAYLLRNPANAERLRQSIKQAEEGRVVNHSLIEGKNRK